MSVIVVGYIDPFLKSCSRNSDKCRMEAFFVLNMGGMLPVSVVDSFQTGALFDFTTQWRDAVDKKFHESN